MYLLIYEPYSEFDPAQLVIDWTKERGLEVHAYSEWAMQRVDRDAKIAVLNGELTRSV